MPSHLFKTSKVRMAIAQNMNRDGDQFMSKEFCYFDSKVKRCRNFVTLTASTYHPLLKQQTVLAVMEAENENSDKIEIFWNLFNQALKSAQQNKNVVLNPVGCCTDMAGANMNALTRVFGETAVNFTLKIIETRPHKGYTTMQTLKILKYFVMICYRQSLRRLTTLH